MKSLSLNKKFKIALLISVFVMPSLAWSQSTTPVITSDEEVLEVKPIEEEDPISLFPSEEELEPTQVNEDNQVPAITSIPADEGGSAIPGIVSEESLAVIDPATAGLFDTKATGGLGVNMWAGSDRAQMKAIFTSLPDRIGSKTLQLLAKKLLLTSAETPNLEGDNEIILTDGIEVLKMRVDRLIALGLGNEARELILAAGLENDQFQAFAEPLLEVSLLESNYAQSCDLVHSQTGKLGEPYWQKNLTFCHLLEGNVDGANFGITILQDYGDDDPLFYALADKILGLNSEIPTVQKLTPLHLAMFEVADLPLPESILTSDIDVNILRALVNNPKTDIQLRMQAAEEGVKLGIIEGPKLAELYMAQSFSPEEIKAPLSTAEANYSAHTRALLYQAAAAEPTEETRAVIIEKALDFARKGGTYGITLAAFEGLIGQMPIRADLWHFADEAARSLYAVGRSKPAKVWIDQLMDQAIRNADAAQELNELWAMSRIASSDQMTMINEEEGRRGWISYVESTVADESEVEILRRLDMAYSLIEVLDRQPVSMQAWEEMATRDANLLALTPNPANVRLVKIAADQNRVAETVGRVIAMLGGTDLSRVSSTSVVTAIEALSQVGLEQETRLLAVEAALENGL
ncbi:hypothetical protein [Curvivirga sp.]|uniref:hypothetical protein n=1 Tax=Curvivirga sp. TaxID=2856848 RepID=UPI003B5C1C9A